MRRAVLLVFALVLAWPCAVQAKEPSVNFTPRRKIPPPEPKAEPVVPRVVPPEPVPQPIPPEPAPIEPKVNFVPPPAAPVPAPVTEWIPPPETVWLDDDLPKGSSTEGTWIWETSLAASGVKSHGHPAGEKIQFHAIAFAEPLPIRATQMIVQQVWLDPQNPPRGIALEFQRVDGEKAGVYWEGETEVFNPAEHEDLWYYGMLPELGQWITLEILAEDLGLEAAQLTGIRFLTFDGRVLWDKTSIKEAPPLEGASPTPPSVNSAQVFDRPS